MFVFAPEHRDGSKAYLCKSFVGCSSKQAFLYVRCSSEYSRECALLRKAELDNCLNVQSKLSHKCSHNKVSKLGTKLVPKLPPKGEGAKKAAIPSVTKGCGSFSHEKPRSGLGP